jgi:hypothetical protein
LITLIFHPYSFVHSTAAKRIECAGGQAQTITREFLEVVMVEGDEEYTLDAHSMYPVAVLSYSFPALGAQV